MCLLSDFEPAGLLLFIPWRVGAERRAGSGTTGNKGTFFCICNSNGNIDCVAVNRFLRLRMFLQRSTRFS